MNLRERLKEEPKVKEVTLHDFLALAFEARNVSHLDHLFTNSATRHETLNGFYDGIVELTDKFAEAYLGKFGNEKEVNSKETILKLQKMCETNKELCKGNTALLNILDEIQGLCLKTLYLLEKK